jgi:hypothetical protein
MPTGWLNGLSPLDADGRKSVKDKTKAIFDPFDKLIRKHFPDAYLASLFKNASRCEQLKRAFACP